MPDPIPLHAPAPEFSRPLKVSGLPEGGLTFRETADGAERAALALRYGVLGVKRFAVAGKLRPEGPGWLLKGRATARITQTCVATLAPLDQIIDEPFERMFIPGVPEPEDLPDLDIDADDPPEPLGREINLGEVGAQTVALALDPYPRADQTAPAEASAAPEGAAPLTDEDVRPKPFASLAALKDKLEKGGDQD
jgi:uncharacterized metal-binding protein YceD (DUF177 family)